MPLHANNKVIRRIELNRFDHTIDRRDRSDAQIVAGLANCLMMARVHLRIRLAGVRQNFRQSRSSCKLDWMRLDNLAAGPVIHGRLQILKQRSAAPHV